MKHLVFAIFCICLAVFGVEAKPKRKPHEQGRIINGVDTPIERAPYQVSIQMSNGMHFCGGSLISNLLVVTAAHCLDDAVPSTWHIRAGVTIWNQGGQVINVLAGVAHERYSKGTLDFDVAVLLLQRPVTFTPTCKPIRLASREPPQGAKLFVTGWGSISTTQQVTPLILQADYLPVVARRVCVELYASQSPIPFTKNMICAGYVNHGNSACHGDSGGPAVFQNTLYGIVSWGLQCGATGVPGVFTNVAVVRPWIKATGDALLAQYK